MQSPGWSSRRILLVIHVASRGGKESAGTPGPAKRGCIAGWANLTHPPSVPSTPYLNQPAPSPALGQVPLNPPQLALCPEPALDFSGPLGISLATRRRTVGISVLLSLALALGSGLVLPSVIFCWSCAANLSLVPPERHNPAYSQSRRPLNSTLHILCCLFSCASTYILLFFDAAVHSALLFVCLTSSLLGCWPEKALRGAGLRCAYTALGLTNSAIDHRISLGFC